LKSEVFIWGHHRRFNSYTEYIRKTFGGRVQKVVVDAGLTCPNRDGAQGTGGCTYCDNRAFNPSYCHPQEPLSRQIEKGIEFHRVRYRRASRFLVYFQPYSNTYAPVEILNRLYREALSCPGVEGLVIGTRPDCVDDEKLAFLSELACHHFIQVEYGIESCYNRTLQRINRGHDFETGCRMVEKTREKGIRTGAHFMFGLPGESRDVMLQEAEIISRMPLDSVKFHQLQIVRGTVMEQEYLANPAEFHQFGLDDYIDFIIRFLEKLSPSIVIERFAGEVPPPFLHHLSWDLIRYDEVLRRIEDEMERRETFQGKFYENRET